MGLPQVGRVAAGRGEASGRRRARQAGSRVGCSRRNRLGHLRGVGRVEVHPRRPRRGVFPGLQRCQLILLFVGALTHPPPLPIQLRCPALVEPTANGGRRRRCRTRRRRRIRRRRRPLRTSPTSIRIARSSRRAICPTPPDVHPRRRRPWSCVPARKRRWKRADGGMARAEGRGCPRSRPGTHPTIPRGRSSTVLFSIVAA
eukprot:scaffold10229_cov116-Isochrysis_galbana.AAC.5